MFFRIKMYPKGQNVFDFFCYNQIIISLCIFLCFLFLLHQQLYWLNLLLNFAFLKGSKAGSCRGNGSLANPRLRVFSGVETSPGAKQKASFGFDAAFSSPACSVKQAPPGMRPRSLALWLHPSLRCDVAPSLLFSFALCRWGAHAEGKKVGSKTFKGFSIFFWLFLPENRTHPNVLWIFPQVWWPSIQPPPFSLKITVRRPSKMHEVLVLEGLLHRQFQIKLALYNLPTEHSSSDELHPRTDWTNQDGVKKQARKITGLILFYAKISNSKIDLNTSPLPLPF